MSVVQAFAELGPAWPVCASCVAQFAVADGGGLIMAHADGCSQVLSMAAQAKATAT